MHKQDLKKVCNLIGVPADDFSVHLGPTHVMDWDNPGLPTHLVGATMMYCFGIWSVDDSEEETLTNPWQKAFPEGIDPGELIEDVTIEGAVESADEFLTRVLDWADEHNWKGPFR